MRNPWILNLLLVALVAMLVLVVVFKPGKQDEQAGKPLTALDTAAITRLRLKRPQDEEIALEKTGDGQWMLVRPLRARSNPFNVNNLLRLAATQSEAQLAAAEHDLAKYGLDKPQSTVWLNDEELQFGNKHPLKNSQYLLYQQTIHLVPADLFHATASPYTDFISTRLIADDRGPVAFAFPDFKLTFEDGMWKKDPADASLGTDDINGFVDEWRHARALSVDKYSGRPVKQRIRVAFAGDGEGKGEIQDILVLGILEQAPEFILYREDETLEYRFPEETGARLLHLKPH